MTPIDKALAAGDHERVARLAAELPDPRDHLHYMLAAFKLRPAPVSVETVDIPDLPPVLEHAILLDLYTRVRERHQPIASRDLIFTSHAELADFARAVVARAFANLQTDLQTATTPKARAGTAAGGVLVEQSSTAYGNAAPKASLAGLRGIVPGALGEQSSEDYVNAIRDEWETPA